MQYQRFACGFLRKLFVILLVCIPAFAFAQEEEKESSFYGTVDLTSHNTWRAIVSGTAPAIQPTFGFNKGNFEIYAWGSWAVNDTYREINIGVSYTLGNFTVELVDYFFPVKGNKLFDFRNSTTTHTAELMLTYEPEAFPLHVMVGSYIFGDDKLESGKNAFSTYAEVGYTHEFNEKNSIGAMLGASLNKSFYTDYEKGFSLVNVTVGYTRVFTLWNYDMPATVECVYNPYLNKVYGIATLTFDLF